MRDFDAMCGWCGTAMHADDDVWGESVPLCSEACWFSLTQAEQDASDRRNMR